MINYDFAPIKIFDAFAGIGGIRLGFEQASDRFQTIYAVDFDQKCKHTYDLNFDVKLTTADIAHLDVDLIPDFDLITAGFPCQPYSIAGKRQALDDKRGEVMYDLIRIIKTKKPKLLFLENVKNFKTINCGEPFKILTDELKKLGYHLKDRVMNTCHYTKIPQNRERIFIVGFLDIGAYNLFEFPDKINHKDDFKKYLEHNIDNKYYYQPTSTIYPKLIGQVTNKSSIYQYRRHYVRENKNGNVPTLTANMGTGGHNVPIIRDELGIRKLTPKECFNFQGFENYRLPQIADASLYKQAGNSVTVCLVKKIAINIFSAYYSNIIANQITLMKPITGCRKIKDHDVRMTYVPFDQPIYANHLIKYSLKFDEINNQVVKIGGRRQNISEAFTEGLYCYLTNSVRVLKIHNKNFSSSFDCYNFDDDKSVQVKASTLKIDCSSFGPITDYDQLVYVDYNDCCNFKIYKIDKKYIDQIVLSKKKNETVKNQKDQKRRPRFSIMKEIIKKNSIEPVFTGNIYDLHNCHQILAKSSIRNIPTDKNLPVVRPNCNGGKKTIINKKSSKKPPKKVQPEKLKVKKCQN
jgi:DNA (cytosine-5)-methyltransferase 1